MAVTPEEILSKRFVVTQFRSGYERTQVDDFLDDVVATMRSVMAERDDYRAQLTAGGQAPREPGDQSDPEVADANRAELEQARATIAAQEARIAELTQALDQAGSATPQDDSARASQVIALAQRLHDEHVREGEQTRDRLVSEAQARHDELVGTAQARHDELLGTAQARHDELVGTAQNAHDELVGSAHRERDEVLSNAHQERDRLIDEGRSQSAGMVAEAEQRRDGILAELESSRAGLQGRIDQLRDFEHSYRSKLRDFLNQHLSALEEDGSRGADENADHQGQHESHDEHGNEG